VIKFAEEAGQRAKDKARAQSDAYDGLTPEEINAMAAAQVAPGL